jgi:hypothetical protein
MYPSLFSLLMKFELETLEKKRNKNTASVIDIEICIRDYIIVSYEMVINNIIENFERELKHMFSMNPDKMEKDKYFYYCEYYECCKKNIIYNKKLLYNSMFVVSPNLNYIYKKFYLKFGIKLTLVNLMIIHYTATNKYAFLYGFV